HIRSHNVTGSLLAGGLSPLPSKRGTAMTYEKLALLRALVARPSREIAPSIQPMLDELCKAGYVMEDATSGWTATAAGCHVVESMRTGGVPVDGRAGRGL